MEPAKAPVLLLILIEPENLRWFVGGIGLDGQVLTLLRSEVGDLEPYRGLDFDEQVSFLRHRFCGVLQRGCHRLWEQQKKATQFILVFEGLLADATGELTQRIAEHLALWMSNPPVAVFTTDGQAAPPGETPLQQLAGDLDATGGRLLDTHFGQLLSASANPDAWELVPKKGSSPGAG